MHIDITGRQIEVTPALRAFTEEKLHKLERLFDAPLEAHVVLRINKHRQAAEILIKAPHLTLTGTEETDDLYASIGQVVDKLERQLRKHKEKRHDHKHRRGPRAPEASQAIAANAAAEATADLPPEPEPRTARIVRSTRYRIKPMSPEDAVLELEATGQEMIVFRETQGYRINVLYRQDDGNFGLIDPDF